MSAGVYRLEHVPTGRFYIGGSLRLEARREHWFRQLAKLAARPDVFVWRGMLPRKFLEFAVGTDPSEWRWSVVEAMDGRPRAHLMACEWKHIRIASEDFPELLLNHRTEGWFFTSVQRYRV